MVGHHYRDAGLARDVDILKWTNYTSRMRNIGSVGFDPHLHGAGAQVYNDMVTSVDVRRADLRLLQDLQIAVDHYRGARLYRDARGTFDAQATADRTYNFRVALADISPLPRRMAAMAWHYVVGTRDKPGILNFCRMIARREPHAVQKFLAARRTPRFG